MFSDSTEENAVKNKKKTTVNNFTTVLVLV